MRTRSAKKVLLRSSKKRVCLKNAYVSSEKQRQDRTVKNHPVTKKQTEISNTGAACKSSRPGETNEDEA